MLCSMMQLRALLGWGCWNKDPSALCCQGNSSQFRKSNCDINLSEQYWLELLLPSVPSSCQGASSQFPNNFPLWWFDLCCRPVASVAVPSIDDSCVDIEGMGILSSYLKWTSWYRCTRRSVDLVVLLSYECYWYSLTWRVRRMWCRCFFKKARSSPRSKHSLAEIVSQYTTAANVFSVTALISTPFFGWDIFHGAESTMCA